MKSYPFVAAPLPYAFDALEPYIDTETMEVHYQKHLEGYVDRLKRALVPYPSLHNRSLEILLCMVERLPQPIRRSVKENAGGVYNHELYFAGMSPNPKRVPTGSLLAAMQTAFGSVDEILAKLKAAGLQTFGSGYVFLVCAGRGRLKLSCAPNQEQPLQLGVYPLLLLYVWERAST